MWHDDAGRAPRSARSWRWCAGASYLLGGVALQADAVARRAQLAAVRLVAVAAGDAGREHLALLERAVVVDLVEHLPVGLIQPAVERRDRCVSDSDRPGTQPSDSWPRRPWQEAAGLDLGAQRLRGACCARRCRSRHRATTSTSRRSVKRASSPMSGRCACRTATSCCRSRAQRHVPRALAVARLAADADLGPRRGETVAAPRRSSCARPSSGTRRT